MLFSVLFFYCISGVFFDLVFHCSTIASLSDSCSTGFEVLLHFLNILELSPETRFQNPFLKRVKVIAPKYFSSGEYTSAGEVNYTNCSESRNNSQT